MSPGIGNNRIEVPNSPDVTAFECPRCGAQMINDTVEGAVRMKPPLCGAFHRPVEMEQVFLGADAFKPKEGK